MAWEQVRWQCGFCWLQPKFEEQQFDKMFAIVRNLDGQVMISEYLRRIGNGFHARIAFDNRLHIKHDFHFWWTFEQGTNPPFMVVHKSCLEFFDQWTPGLIGNPAQAFCLLKALQAEYKLRDSRLKPWSAIVYRRENRRNGKSRPLPPFPPRASSSVASQSLSPITPHDDRLSTLPNELLLLLFDYLSPESLFNLFYTSQRLRALAPRFFASHHYYLSDEEKEWSIEEYIRTTYRLSQEDYSHAWKRLKFQWDVRYRRYWIASNYPKPQKEFYDKDQPQFLSLHEIVKARLFWIEIGCKEYICGLQIFDANEMSISIGRCKVNVDHNIREQFYYLNQPSPTSIGYTTDGIGLSNVCLDSVWIPERKQGSLWECHSERGQSNVLKFYFDEYKLRELVWQHSSELDADLEFASSLSMKPTHARHVGKVTKARFWESELSRLQRLVTLLVFPKDISNITVYFDRGEHNVLGIRVDSMTSSQLHGVMGGEVQSFPISGPNEGIVSIVVEDSPQRARSLVFRTNWDRQYTFGTGGSHRLIRDTASLCASDGRYLTGMYVGADQGNAVACLGVVEGCETLPTGQAAAIDAYIEEGFSTLQL